MNTIAHPEAPLESVGSQGFPVTPGLVLLLLLFLSLLPSSSPSFPSSPLHPHSSSASFGHFRTLPLWSLPLLWCCHIRACVAGLTEGLQSVRVITLQRSSLNNPKWNIQLPLFFIGLSCFALWKVSLYETHVDKTREKANQLITILKNCSVKAKLLLIFKRLEYVSDGLIQRIVFKAVKNDFSIIFVVNMKENMHRDVSYARMS